MKDRTFGVGIVGAGRVFEQHARACAELGPLARLLAIADVDETRLRSATSQHFIPFAHGDYRALLERRDIDVVAVCTPPALHERIVIDALEAGKFVMCEKPLAHSLEAADRIIAAARRYPGRLTTVFQFRCLPEVRRTRWLLEQGHLGRPLFGRFTRYARFDSPRKSARPGKARKPGKERADWWGQWHVAGGGVVITQLIHDLDLMCHLFGKPSEVTAIIDTLKEPIESEDTCTAMIRFENGALGCCYGTMTAQRTASAFDVIGESASAHSPWAFECADRKRREQALREVRLKYPMASDPAAGGFAAAVRARLRSLRFRPEPSTFALRASVDKATTAHTAYVRDVLDAIADGRPLPVGPQEARVSLELSTAIYASGLIGRPVALPIDRTDPCYAGLTAADYDRREQRVRNSKPQAPSPKPHEIHAGAEISLSGRAR
jgi:UDP-N-acetyl-2-amino-2-deoxyglucuronate dehydrogenase